MKHLYFFMLIILFSCKNKNQPTAQQIIDNSIKFNKLDVLNNASISFSFRGNNYKANRSKGDFELIKIVENDSISIKDILSNKGFKRYINDSLVLLSEKDKRKFSQAVNSVHYFSILPLGLNDAAVQKKILETVIIKGKEYYKIQITFLEEGGGEDFDDVFIYWFAKDNFELDYLAYKYHTNGGGIRFRDIKNKHLVNGIRLVDYNNYKPITSNIDFYKIDELYEKDKLKKISEIILNDIRVKEYN